MITLSQRRARANAIAAKQGAPVTQAAIDARWSALAERINASPHAPVEGTSPRPASSRAPESQEAIDARWTSLVNDHNKRVGLATPIADRSR
jgi:hypothetical protein